MELLIFFVFFKFIIEVLNNTVKSFLQVCQMTSISFSESGGEAISAATWKAISEEAVGGSSQYRGSIEDNESNNNNNNYNSSSTHNNDDTSTSLTDSADFEVIVKRREYKRG